MTCNSSKLNFHSIKLKIKIIIKKKKNNKNKTPLVVFSIKLSVNI